MDLLFFFFLLARRRYGRRYCFFLKAKPGSPCCLDSSRPAKAGRDVPCSPPSWDWFHLVLSHWDSPAFLDDTWTLTHRSRSASGQQGESSDLYIPDFCGTAKDLIPSLHPWKSFFRTLVSHHAVDCRLTHRSLLDSPTHSPGLDFLDPRIGLDCLAASAMVTQHSQDVSPYIGRVR